MTDVILAYIERFMAKLDSAKTYQNLLQRCWTEGEHRLLTVAEGVTETDIKDEDAARNAFFSFLMGDGNVSGLVAHLHAGAFAAFDAFDTSLTHDLKDAARKMLEGEFAVWYAHKQLLEAAIQDPALLEELAENDDMIELILREDGFALHEQLCFADIWAEVFPQEK